MQPRSQGWWTQLVATTKSKGDPFKADFDRFCFWNVFSVIYDESYAEGFTDDDIFEKCGKRHPVSSIVRYQ